MQARVQDRVAGALGAGVVVALFGYLLLLGLTVSMEARREPPMTLVDLPPPPQRHPPRPPVEHPHARKAAGRASPRNLRNKAAEIVARPAPVPPPIPVIAAAKPAEGTAAANGASDRPGPGEGAGGAGDDTGSGDNGDGDGDGGVPPRQIKGRLKPSDLPPDIVAAGIGGTVSVRYSVDVDGSANGCIVTGSSGNAELDRLTCRLIEQRFRFKPSRDEDGQPVRSAIEQNHVWIIDRVPAAASRP